MLLLPLLRCKPYLTSVPTDCGSFSPCEASLELPTCRPASLSAFALKLAAGGPRCWLLLLRVRLPLFALG